MQEFQGWNLVFPLKVSSHQSEQMSYLDKLPANLSWTTQNPIRTVIFTQLFTCVFYHASVESEFSPSDNLRFSWCHADLTPPQEEVIYIHNSVQSILVHSMLEC